MQLRLDLAESPAPAAALWELVGEEHRQAAMALLAVMIAQTVAPEAASDERVWPVEARTRLDPLGMTEALSDWQLPHNSS